MFGFPWEEIAFMVVVVIAAAAVLREELWPSEPRNQKRTLYCGCEIEFPAYYTAVEVDRHLVGQGHVLIKDIGFEKRPFCSKCGASLRLVI